MNGLQNGQIKTIITIPFLYLKASYRELKDGLDDAYRRVTESGWYILGNEAGSVLSLP